MRALSRTLWMFVCTMTILAAGASRLAAAETPLRAAAPAVTKGSPVPTSIDDLELTVGQRVPAFGGMFLDGKGQLNIYLTDSSQLVAAESTIDAVFGKGRFDVAKARAVKARYTFVQLKGWHDLHRMTTLAIRGVVSSGIRKTTNRLHIGVSNADAASSVQSVLARYEIPAAAVEIETVKALDPYDSLRDNHRPLVGGLQIVNDKGEGCTLGYLAVLGGKAGFVTCSHCTDVQGGVEGTVEHQATVSSDLNRIAVEQSDPKYFTGSGCPSGRQCRFTDTSFFARDGGSDPLTHRAEADFGQIAFVDSNLEIITDLTVVGSLDPIDGDFVTKVGRTTGLTDGVISDTCTDFNQNTTTKTIFCSNVVQGLSGPGDSGSAVFVISQQPPPIGANTIPVFLVGTLWGGDGTIFAFSPFSATVTELGAMRVSLGQSGTNSAPEVKIVQPQNHAAVGVGGFNFVDWKAEIVDYEGCCQDVTWQSSVDSVMGHGAELDFTFQSPGLRTVTVTATDKDGGVGSDSIQVTAGTTPPSVTIVKPTVAQPLYAGIPYVFDGTSFDPNEPFLAIACSSLTWKSSKAGDPFPVSGCNPQITFTTLGSRTLTLTGTDSHNLTASASVTVNVTTAPVNGPPTVSILSPIDDAFLPAQTAVTLKGLVQDPANASPLTYQWLLFDGPTVTVLATGTIASGGQPTFTWTPSNNVGFNCGGEPVTLKLAATNPSNQTGAATIEAFISYPTC